MKNLKLILTKEEINQLIVIFFFSLFGIILETVGIGIIPLFLLTVNEPHVAIEKIPFDDLKNYLESFSNNDLNILLVSVLLVFFLFKNILIFLMFFYESKKLIDLKINMSKRLLNIYMSKNYLFHTNNNPQVLAKNVGAETYRANSFIKSKIYLYKELTLILFILTLLLIADTKTAIISIIFFSSLGLLYFFSTKKKIIKKSEIAYKEREKKSKIIIQIFHSVIDVILFNKFFNLKKEYKKTVENEFSILRFIEILNRIPKLFIEILLVSILSVFLIVYVNAGNSMETIVPMIALYTIAAIRIYPSFINISLNLNSINAEQISYNATLREFKKYKNTNIITENENSNKIIFKENITFEDVSFNYKEKQKAALKNISLKINRNSSVAFIGKTGCGKSTLINILMGLIEPDSGSVKSDNKNINTNYKDWQKKIGYVYQNLYLTDDTIIKNIAFGENDAEIDINKVNEVIKKVSLEEFVKSLPDKLNTFVGANGIRLSGGQRQRIGLARALYKDPEILIFDEATSALDDETELEIMNELSFLKNKKTLIFISHKQSTIKNCDTVFELDNGKIVSERPAQS